MESMESPVYYHVVFSEFGDYATLKETNMMVSTPNQYAFNRFFLDLEEATRFHECASFFINNNAFLTPMLHRTIGTSGPEIEAATKKSKEFWYTLSDINVNSEDDMKILKDAFIDRWKNSALAQRYFDKIDFDHLPSGDIANSIHTQRFNEGEKFSLYISSTQFSDTTEQKQFVKDEIERKVAEENSRSLRVAPTRYFDHSSENERIDHLNYR